MAAAAWAALEETFERASRADPEGTRPAWWRIGGRRVRGRFAGIRLATRLGQAFAHLRTEDHGLSLPELAIDACDGESTGISPARGTILDSIPGRVEGGGVSLASGDGRYYIHEVFDSRAILDRETCRLLWWTASAQRLSLFERGKPFRVLLTVWLHDRGIQVVHAALVSSNGRGVLLPGRGGSGKTTSALACALGGLDYLGDDYLGLERHTDGSFIGHSLYESGWLDPGHLPRFPSLVPHAVLPVLPRDRKCLVHLSQVLPERLVESVTVRLLALPRIAHAATTRSRPASRGESLLAIAPSSVFELSPRVGAEGVDRLVALVTRLPTHWLELGRELGEIPARIDELLAGAAA